MKVSKEKASDKKKTTTHMKRQLKKKKRLSNTLTKRNSEGSGWIPARLRVEYPTGARTHRNMQLHFARCFLSISANIPIEGLVADGKII